MSISIERLASLIQRELANIVNQEVKRKDVGYINLIRDTYRSTLLTTEQLQKIKLFAQKNKIDSVIWTDIPPNFQEIMGKPFTKNIVADRLRFYGL
ncbi:MAG: hypothetical protein ACO3MF_03955, partial [Acholeplasmataceae bacterium]